ncbi:MULTISPECIES: NAD(P)/FAD-dependent oxidoreductase [unclassified Rhodococcus (in: high G+C Gram-positive bacteria)]|uniref:phytoene desaturase family protein n=1 Tax=unclassified Rhodococcus (in: high G+C Gram-positive bacteria) TaxID=192944 RepID=UPI0016397429|nr:MULTISPECIES: NAD(P)/FAD-dependent oxidoreductase [unclassified Rhodococcus (in: high G+C Gram-positive bacteria)]MBC2637845.1 NAD(P)/FAD-dependent oxidoreductase [Rhodococcus sp. 3A]MBC2897407.1 NAD(P)/FAD-dependent oxidoreductase [Rhodococcus sp. 4CII]
MTTALVVGSGPNGLAAALTLAAEGVDVTVLEASDSPGGGTRSGEVTLPGLLHDHCSGFHPLALDTGFSRQFDLAAHGLEWLWPEVQYAHPLHSGRGAAVVRSVEETAAGLGGDGSSYRRMFGPLSAHFHDIVGEFLQPMVHVPRHPFALGWFGVHAALPATVLARRWRTDGARALFGGVAAHAFRPFGSVMSSAIGVALGTAAHRYGWPVARGGSAAISRAMVSALESYGGRVETGALVRDHRELGRPDILMLNTTPAAAASVLGSAQPPRIARAYSRFRHGPGAFQVSYAVEDGIPWGYEPSRRAGTVHVGGNFEEIAAAERDVVRGVMPDRPFVLVGQQSVADTGRASDGVHPVDVYAHVPSGWSGDATEIITAQIERYAPGFRARILSTRSRSVAQIEQANPNYVGGDIITGANTARQLVFRPRVTLQPYATGVPGAYLCSAAAPPGAGAHGMAGWNAARAALADLAP